MEYLNWFDSVCSELSTNPQAASEKFMMFRETEDAFNASIFVISNSSNENVLFQALLILQYSFLKKWGSFGADQREILKSSLWNLFLSANTPSFVSNIAIQTFCLKWKRGWTEYSNSERDSLFDSISNFLNASNNYESSPKVSILLRILLEEFSGKSKLDIGAPLQFHKNTHSAFEAYGLDKSFILGIHLLESSVRILLSNSLDQNFEFSCRSVKEASKLMHELLNWDFGGNNIYFHDKLITSNTNSNLVIPDKWDVIFQHIGSIFEIYVFVRSALLNLIQNKSNTKELKICNETMESLRQLLISISSFSGPIIETETKKQVFCEGYINNLIKILEMSSSSISENSSLCDSEDFDLLVSRESEAIATIVGKLFANFKLVRIVRATSFESFIYNIGKSTHALALSLSNEVQKLLNKSGENYSLLDSWRGDVVSLMLDSWSQFIDDPLLLYSEHMIDFNSMNSDLPQSPLLIHVKSSIRQLTFEVFRQIFDSVLNVTIFETMSYSVKDEDDEIEAIECRSTVQFISAACVLGRADIVSSMNYLSTKFFSAMSEMEVCMQSTTQAKNSETCNRLFEIFRVCLLFAKSLLIDSSDYEEISGAAETRLIPSFIIDAGYVSSDSSKAVLAVVSMIARLLEFQLNSSKNCKDLFSVLISKNILFFFADYIGSYVDPDISLYPLNSQIINSIFAMHGNEFNSVVSLLLEACYHFLVYYPLEIDLVTAVACLLKILSSNKYRIQHVISDHNLKDMYRLITEDESVAVSRLNPEGITLIWEAFAHLICNYDKFKLFDEYCSYAMAKVQMLSNVLQSDTNNMVNSELVKVETIRVISILNGMAKSPVTENKKSLISLFNSSIPVVTFSVKKDFSQDDLLLAHVNLLKDYAENQLVILPPNSSVILYRATFELLQMISVRFSNIIPISQSSADTESSFRETYLKRCLELLNHLANKDFFDFDPIDDLDASVPPLFRTTNTNIPSSSGPVDQQAEVVNILLFGIEIISKIINADLLRSFPSVTEPYFSFLTYLFSSHEKAFCQRMISTHSPYPRYNNTLQLIVEQLLWGAGAISSIAGRFALQGLTQLADFHFKSIASGGHGFDCASNIQFNNNNQIVSANLFEFAKERLLDMIFSPSSSDYGISMDRMDACAGTFFAFQAFINTDNSFTINVLSKYPEQISFQLQNCLQKFINSNNSQIKSFRDKQSKMLYIRNMKIFVGEARSLINFA